MRILVTGGTGFVGQHLLAMLGDHEVFATTRGRPLGRTDLDHVSWITADLSQEFDTAKLPAHVDAIIHLAQSERYRDFPAGAHDVFRINVDLPNRLISWAQATGVSRAVFASTGTIYEPFTGPMTETSAVAPTGYYGASKLACETLTSAYQSSALSIAHMRIFFVYGPGQGNSLIARLMGAVADNKPVTLPQSSDGLIFVPTFVTDTAATLVQACEGSWQGVWNVASPHRISMAGLIDEISQAVGRPALITRIDQVEPGPIVPDLTKLASKIDLATFTTPRDGVRRTMSAKPE